ncbi:hypothetical protein D1872_308780 [compost metagenome]
MYDPVTRMLKKGEDTIGLGEVQQAILHALITQQGKVVNTYTLMNQLESPNPNALRVNIAKLKARLGLEIKNIRGQGYILEKV